jgi:GGDEF domain-containing protein
MSSKSKSQTPGNEQTALACYLSTVVAIGNCMGDVCPSVGAMYRDRLLKLPRRLGFDATPQALEQSRDAVATDLLEYSRTASAWTTAGSNHVTKLLEHLRETEDTLAAAAELQSAFLDDLAEHITTSAEVDDEAQLRMSFKRYAAGLSAYARKTRSEKLSSIAALESRRAEIEGWLAEATKSSYIDPETGLLNRAAAEMRIETEIDKKQPFCVIIVGQTPEGSSLPASTASATLKLMADRLSETIRPYDMIFRWSQDQLITIFEATAVEIAARIRQIGGWLGDGTCEVEIGGETSVVKTHPFVYVIECADEESTCQLITRIELESRREMVAG